MMGVDFQRPSERSEQIDAIAREYHPAKQSILRVKARQL